MIDIQKKYSCLTSFFLMILVMCMGCSEFIEEPIQDKEVPLLSPGDGANLESYVIDFKWEKVAFALSYKVQIASPSFDSVQYFPADTILKSVHFTMTLPTGHFEWRVKALKGRSAQSRVGK